MTCAYEQITSPSRIDGTVERLYPGFQVVASTGWRLLLRCPSCGQLWKMDEYDKYQTQLAMKVSNAPDWDTDDTIERKAYLLASRGGLGTDVCGWIDCPNTQLRGSAYCVDHLYATGARA